MDRDIEFEDRSDAGRQLAEKLGEYQHQPGVRVLALPRGGVPVAYEVAKALGAPLDVFLVRKLGVPGQEELAMGAIASGGIKVVNRDVVDQLRISSDVIQLVARSEQEELDRREKLYRGGRPPLDVEGQTVILIDDGLATGSTMRAAVAALRQKRPAKIVVAVPVGAAETCEDFSHEVDEVICVSHPRSFEAVGRWYHNFTQTSDAEVRNLLERAADFLQDLPHPQGSSR